MTHGMFNGRHYAAPCRPQSPFGSVRRREEPPGFVQADYRIQHIPIYGLFLSPSKPKTGNKDDIGSSARLPSAGRRLLPLTMCSELVVVGKADATQWSGDSGHTVPPVDKLTLHIHPHSLSHRG